MNIFIHKQIQIKVNIITIRYKRITQFQIEYKLGHKSD
jgi:hypothetical protein